MMLRRTTNRGSGTRRRWRPWILIALAALILSACRGLDTQPLVTEQAGGGPPPAVAARALEAPRAAASQASPLPAGRDAGASPQVIRAAVSSAASAATAPSTAQSLVAVSPPYPTSYAQPCPQFPSQPCCPAPCPDGSQAIAPWCPEGVPCGGWRPPGLPCPWPEDEYLCDGGDQLPSVRVRGNWSVDGLQLEDTVVHYDTLDGDTHVQPSNRVCIYAPRFASVRKVYGIVQQDHWDRIARIDQPLAVTDLGDAQLATTAVQPVPPRLNLGLSAPSRFREHTPLIGLENRQGLVGTHGSVIPYEDITEVQRALLSNTEKARLAAMIQAAVTWSHEAAVQVVIDNIATHEDVAATGAESVHIYSLEGKPRLRVCKLASRQEARPGETVEFTLLFENVGDQPIGNVTVIDSLTTRLEYVADSQSCSLQANFSSAENQGESLVLRWEIAEPMKVGESGVIRFTCRVR